MKVFKPREEKNINRRSTNYLSVDKYPSVPGWISCIMGIIGMVFLVFLFVLSYVNKGTAGMWIGVLGIFGMLLTLAGIIVAVIGFRDPEALHTRDVIGISGNGLLLLFYIILYVAGL